LSTEPLLGGAAFGQYEDYRQPVGAAQTFAFHQLPRE
jgi:hypothetical protein